MSKRIILVGGDAAPSRCFERFGPVLRERGFDVDIMVGNGKPLKETKAEIMFAVSRADVVILGMSTSDETAQFEIMAGETARDSNITYGFYGDSCRTWAGACSGAWFEKLAANAIFYFGENQKNADVAKKVFSKAKCFGTGNPISEENALTGFTREAVRLKLGVLPDEKLVLAPGGKFSWGNMAQWTILMQALVFLGTASNRFKLILAMHPGDRMPCVFYEELVSYSPIPAEIVSKDILDTPDIVPGADIIVEFGTSVAISGAYHNVPAISLGFEPLFRVFEKFNYSRIPGAIEDGISELVVADASKLAEKIRILLTPEGFAQMRARQLALYPKPKERGIALRKMADAIEQILAQ